MEIKNFIQTKENGNSHTTEEINYFIKNLNSFSQNEITQWLKAVKHNGLDLEETSALTLAMANSGEILSWEELEPVIDKHSTGGIGDKVTLLFVPLLAAYGINVPKLSGRSLGITGGTIDKLESIPGFRTNLTIEEIKNQVKEIGLAIASASSNLAPADKRLYAIRDVTDTIDSIPLIASSIMSKKIAMGAKNIILDVKCGTGAFMKTIERSVLLADTMTKIGSNLNKNIKTVITDMNQPLGNMIGNTLEIKEALEVLSGKEVQDLVEVVISLAKEAILLIEPTVSIASLEKKLMNLLLQGGSLSKFEKMVTFQGGNLSKLSESKYIEKVRFPHEGYIQQVDAKLIGEVVFSLGGGRTSIKDSIDYASGITLFKKIGDFIKKDETILEIHTNNLDNMENIKNKLLSSVTISKAIPNKIQLIHKISRK